MWFVFRSWAQGQLLAACILSFLAMAFFWIFGGDSDDREERRERAKVAHKEAQKTYRAALKHSGDVNKRNADGMTPLMLAAEANDLGPAIELVAKGAFVNARSSEGWTPLMFAARRGNVEMVRFLLEHGALVNIRDMDGRTPLLCAVTPRNKLRLESWENCMKRFPVSHGALKKDPEVLRLLLEHGAAVDAKDEVGGLTALQYCFFDEYFTPSEEDAVRILLKHGASTKVVTDTHNNLLHLAANQKWQARSEIIRLLLEHGVPADAWNDDRETPLFFYLKKAQWMASASIVRIFLEHGTDVNGIGENGQSLLHYVCGLSGNDAVESARFLLKHGVPVDAQDLKGETPLMYAVSHGRYENIQFLLKNGASVNTRSYNGRSALMHAAMHKEGNAVRLLLEYGASITLEDLRNLEWCKDDMIKAGFYWELQDAAYR